jgi:enamine deaminase RidA (YjgF/YER057c/UK114 family)
VIFDFVMPNLFFLLHSAKRIGRKTLSSRIIEKDMLYSDYSGKDIRVSTGKWIADNSKGQSECFAVLSIDDMLLPYGAQVDVILDHLHKLADYEGTPVLIRFFLSDPANQTALLREKIELDCPVSIIGQAPLNGSKIAAVVWFRKQASVCRLTKNMYKVTGGSVDEFWFTGGISDSEGPYNQTVSLLDELSSGLEAQGLTLEADCMRTWLFVQNIDVNYKGVVEGRNAVFDRHDLTVDTHFIASTGIEGRTENHQNKVMLDAVAVSGQGVKVRFLHGLSHLNRTSDYGVRFERGALVERPDCRCVFISGTASIDNKGKILYEGDIVRQTERMIENVEVLLAESGCGFGQVGSMIVYLRDASDYAVVKSIFDKRFPDCPRVIVQAPVCRPGWLVEMECIAIY